MVVITFNYLQTVKLLVSFLVDIILIGSNNFMYQLTTFFEYE